MSRCVLGRDLVVVPERRGEDVVGLTRQDLDIADEAAVGAALHRAKPDVVVFCATWTVVDEAEEHEDDAFRVNGQGAGNVAAACGDEGIRLVYDIKDRAADA